MPADPGGGPDTFEPPRSFTARILIETFGRTGARLGAAWIGVLAIAAIFAPFLANSHPLALQWSDGSWSSPLLEHLTAADVSLLVLFFTAVGLALLRGTRKGPRVLFWVVMAVVTIFLTAWPNLPDVLRFYRQGDMATFFEPWCAKPRLFIVTGGAALFGLVLAAQLLGGLAKASGASRVLLIGWYGLVVTVLVIVPVTPPSAIVYSKHREAIEEGKTRFVLRTPIAFSPTDYQRDHPDPRLLSPRPGHWLGTEVNGADLLSRMIHASRVALAIGLISTGIALIIGIVIGSIMGYQSGTADIIGMRLVEIVEAIPTLFLLIIFVSFFGRNLYFMMAIIGMTSWTGYCRFIRAEFLKLRQQDFIQAARACGLPMRSILFRHMLPNGVAPVLVSASFGVASAILAETTLSFLGLGLVDEPSWGEMLNQALGIGGTFHWWLATFPGLAIFLTVFSYNLVGEAMRDAIDPHTKKPAAI